MTRPLSGGPVSPLGASVPLVTDSAGPAALSDDHLPDAEEVLDLDGSVGWAAYTRHPDVLARALEGSTTVVTARRGGRLVERVLEIHADVRQRVLVTDAEPGQRTSYESLGFTELHEVGGEDGPADGETGLRGFISWAQG